MTHAIKCHNIKIAKSISFLQIKKGCKMKQFFEEIRKKGQGNKFFAEDIKRHPEDDSPKYLSTSGSRFFALHARIKRIWLTPLSYARVAQNDVINKIVKNLFPCSLFPSPLIIEKTLTKIVQVFLSFTE